MLPIIETKDLRKIFISGGHSVNAVNGIDLVVKKGEIFGFLGPNGAGKTTTMRILTTLLKPSTGTATICGYDVKTQEEMVRKNIGYVSQVGGLERSATTRENLVLQARIFNFTKSQAQERAQELIKSLNLESFADRNVETYSGGQRRRADIALGMVHKPQLLFLDEPTVGLDPQSRAQVWQEMKKLRDTGTTIFFTTHYLDEADLLCDRVAIVDHGKIIALDTPTALKRHIASDVIILGMPEEKIASVDVSALFGTIADIREIITEKESVRFLVHHGEVVLPQILRICDKENLHLTTISLHKPTLDDVFLQKTGKSFTEQNA